VPRPAYPVRDPPWSKPPKRPEPSLESDGVRREIGTRCAKGSGCVSARGRVVHHSCGAVESPVCQPRQAAAQQRDAQPKPKYTPAPGNRHPVRQPSRGTRRAAVYAAQGCRRARRPPPDWRAHHYRAPCCDRLLDVLRSVPRLRPLAQNLTASITWRRRRVAAPSAESRRGCAPCVEHGRELRERLDTRIPRLRVDRRRELRAVSARVRAHPVRGLDDIGR